MTWLTQTQYVQMEDKSVEQGTPMYTVVDVDEFPTFVAAMGSEARLYPKALLFAKLETARIHRWLWISIMLLDQAILVLYSKHPELWTGSEGGLANLSGEIASSVDQLCRSIPYYVSRETGIQGSTIATDTLYFLQPCLERWQMGRHLRWSRRVAEAFGFGRKVALIMDGKANQSAEGSVVSEVGDGQTALQHNANTTKTSVAEPEGLFWVDPATVDLTNRDRGRKARAHTGRTIIKRQRQRDYTG